MCTMPVEQLYVTCLGRGMRPCSVGIPLKQHNASGGQVQYMRVHNYVLVYFIYNLSIELH